MTVDYVAAVNRALDHVRDHLDGPLRLDDVARTAGFSPFHFHRVFRALVGETLGDHVKRVRLDRALFLMTHGGAGGARPPLTEVALACGFSSSSDFSRCFKQRFGVPPSVFDVSTWRDARRAELEAATRRATDPVDGARAETRGADAARATEPSPRRLTRLPPGENPDGFRVELVELPPRTVAYRRVEDPYRGGDVTGTVRRHVAWAEEHGLADGAWLAYQWEDPEITPLEQCRYDIAVVVPPGHPVLRVPGEVGRHDFPAMTVARVRVDGDVALELRALDWLFGTWLPSSGHVPDDQPCFEAFVGRPFAHGTERFVLDALLPVRR